MNFESIQAQQAELFRVAEQSARTAERWLLVYFALLAVYLLLVIVAAVHCANKGPEKNNASWMMIIILVPFGSIVYWFFAPESEERIPAKSDGVFPPPAPFKPASLSVAESVNAAVAADAEKKRGRIYPQL